MPDIYLYAGEPNPPDVRLRDPTTPVITSAVASLAWTEADDGAAITVNLSQSLALAWTEANDGAAANVTLTATGSIAWTEADDAAAIVASVFNGVSLAWTEDTDTASITVSVAVTNADASLAWTEDNDGCAIVAFSDSTPQRGGVGPAWDNTRGLTPELRAKIRKQLEEEIAEPIREAIAAQSKTRFESMEAEERAIRAATEAAQIEYQALYLRLLAYQREEVLMEEEAIVMTMFAALSR